MGDLIKLPERPSINLSHEHSLKHAGYIVLNGYECGCFSIDVKGLTNENVRDILIRASSITPDSEG